MPSKLTIFIIILLFLTASLFFVFKNFSQLKDKFAPKPPTASSDNTNQGNSDILDKTGQFIENQSQKTTQNIGDFLGEKTRSTLENILPIKNAAPKVSTIDKSATDAKAVSTIDLAKDSTIKLNLTKNNKYYLGFSNVPPNYCLYIGASKYPIPQGKNLELEFTSSGLFSLKANACDLGDKNLGEITVE